MKRIGILTLMNMFNYGGMLQCLSLSRTLQKMGHDVTVIDYPTFPRSRLIRRWMYSLGDSIGSYLEQKQGEKQFGVEIYRMFDGFRRSNLKLSKSCNSYHDLQEFSRNLDILLVGSDQVWNLDWFTPAYFLNFVKNFSGQKVSYAACFGHASQPEEHLQQVGTWLKDFDKLSVRNTMSQTIVKRLTGRDSQIVADPTLLCNLNDLVAIPNLPFEKYILLYSLSKKRFERVLPFLLKLRQHLGLPIVAVKSQVLQPWDMPGIDYYFHTPTIQEWLGLFSKSSFVVTDSFHGTIYSIKNRLPFLNYIGSDKTRERIIYIVERYGLQAACPVEVNGSDPIINQNLKYEYIEKEVYFHVNESLSFLESL